MLEPFGEIGDEFCREFLEAVPGTQYDIESQANVHTNNLVANVLQAVALMKPAKSPEPSQQQPRPANEGKR